MGSEPFEMPEDMAHSTDEFEEGWLVVRGFFYSLVQKSPRGYKLTKASRLFLVNTMIRYPNIIFAGGSVGKAPREARAVACRCLRMTCIIFSRAVSDSFSCCVLQS